MPTYPAHPEPKFNDMAGKDVRVEITHDHKVFIGGFELPGWIAGHGVRLEVGDKGNINVLQVRFLVGDVTIDDAVAKTVTVSGTAETVAGVP
jgi:hypothetical protein